MAIEFRLRCNTTFTLPQIEDVLLSNCNLTVAERSEITLGRKPGTQEDETGKMVVYQGQRLTCFIHPESTLGKSVIQEAFGFSPNISVTFRLDKFDDEDVGTDTMMSICRAIIRDLSTDCVLLENGDFPMLLRKGHSIVIQPLGPYWNTRLKELARAIGDPYSLKVLPVI